jgi:hypothetical protein
MYAQSLPYKNVKGSSPLRGGTKSASDPNSQKGYNSTGSIAIKMANIQLIQFSLCRFDLKVSDVF